MEAPNGAPAAAAASDVNSGSTFTAVDYTLFSIMLVTSICIGVYSALKSHGKTSTQEYMLGERSMSPVAVALSLLGGITSAISILGNATETYLFGTQVTTTLLGCIPGIIFVSQVILPIFYNLKIVSLDEYLELRFKSRCLRKMATCCQLLMIAMSMSMGVYVPSLALSAVTNLTTVTSILIMGSISTFYVTIGGVKAVVYTDVLQTLLMFVGVLVVVVVCCVNLGGVATVWHIADHGSRLEFFNMDTSPFVRHSLCSTVVLGFYLMIGVVGCNQPTYQRLASVSTLHTAQWLCIFTLVGVWCLWSLFFFSGLVAYATYRDCDPLTTGKITKPDQIIPFLVTDKLNHLTGMAGIFVSAVYGGVLSTLSTLGNSAACLIWEDFLKHRPYFSRLSSAGAIKAVMIISAGTGVMATSLGLMVGGLGNAFHVIVSINSAISGPLCGIFLTGICAPWVNHKSVVVGFVTSILYSLWTIIGKFLRGGGSPRRLPLSTQGCPGALAFNTTVEVLLNTTMSDRYEFKTIYDVSYCYLGMIGIILTTVVASLVSCCTGVATPQDLPPGTVNASCERVYRRVTVFLRDGKTGSSIHSTWPDEATFNMLPIHHPHHPK